MLHRSCHDCNRRKVRCNKESPCDNCVRLGLECTFPPPGRKPREKKVNQSTKKSQLLSRLSLLEQEVQKLGGQNQPRASSQGPPEQQCFVQNSQNNRNLQSWLAGNVAADQSMQSDEHDSEKREKGRSPQENSTTLSDQFGRLVLDRNSGNSRYVNGQVLTELADQVYCTLHRAQSAISSQTSLLSIY